MPKSPLTGDLIKACLEARPFAWQAFVDQCAPAVLESIRSLGHSTGRKWTEDEVARYSTKVFESLRAEDYALLRSLDSTMNSETFLTVVVRRTVSASESTSG
jgi:hypothetical protein